MVGTLLWVVVSLLFKVYIANFTDYNATYGAVGGVIVLLLWFYVSSLAILVGAELNAEIEHASPYGKAPGQKSAQGKLLLGRRAERAFRDRQTDPPATPKPVPPTIPDRKPRALPLGALFVGGILLSRLRHRMTRAARNAPVGAGGHRLERPMTQQAQSPALRELFGAVSEDLRALVSQTIALARLEFAAATSALVTSVVGVALSLVIVLGGIGVLMSALVLIAIALGFPAWAAATGVGLVLAIGGALSARRFLGKARSVSVTLSETRESIKETIEWLKTQANS